MNTVRTFSLPLTPNKSLYRKFSVNKIEDVISSVNFFVPLQKLACRRRSFVVVSALDFRSEGRWFEDHFLPWCCGYRRHTAGGNPAMDQHSTGRGGQYSQLLHGTETGISSGRVGPLGSSATLPSPKVASPASSEVSTFRKQRQMGGLGKKERFPYPSLQLPAQFASRYLKTSISLSTR